jgi:hypothetical protein
VLDRITALRSGGFGLTVERRDAPGDGWLAADALGADLDRLVEDMCALAPLEHPPLGAEWLLEHCAWQGASLAVAALMDGWVPDLAPANVLLLFRDGGVWGIALRDVRPAGSYGDPERARALGEAMLAPPSPMHVPLRSACTPEGMPFHVRASCCLYHRVPGAEVCAGCPLRDSPRLRAAA